MENSLNVFTGCIPPFVTFNLNLECMRIYKKCNDEG